MRGEREIRERVAEVDRALGGLLSTPRQQDLETVADTLEWVVNDDGGAA